MDEKLIEMDIKVIRRAINDIALSGNDIKIFVYLVVNKDTASSFDFINNYRISKPTYYRALKILERRGYITIERRIINGNCYIINY